MSVTPIVRMVRQDGPGRSSGFVEPLAGRGATWVSYEVDLSEGILRLDARLVTGALIGTTCEVFPESVAQHRDRVRWKVGCPGCGHAIRHIYIARLREPEFGCRRCLRLAYASTRLRAPERAALKVHELRRRAGGAAAPLWEPFPTRPARMRRTTWIALEREAHRWLHVYAEGLVTGVASPALMIP